MTDLMTSILRALDEQGAMTPNRIGMALGLRQGDVHGSGSGSGRGSGYRAFGPAQRIIFPLTRLRELGLVAFTRRVDGLSGTAYAITPAGREALKA